MEDSFTEFWELTRCWDLYKNKKPNKKKRKRSIPGRRSTKENKGNANTNISEFNKLSMDLISSIFIRCPVNELSMLRCASKSWNDVITSPFFVHSHLEQSKEKAQVLFLKPIDSKVPHAGRDRLQFVSVDTEGNGESNELYTVTVPDLLLQFYKFSWLVCAGLVCLSSGRCIYLCNPVMQQLYRLPQCSPNVFSASDNIGFGYLHSTKEYKVVRFFYRSSGIPYWDPHNLQLCCEMFTLNEAGCISTGWKEIAETPPCHPLRSGLLINDCLYWMGKISHIDVPPDQVLSFDFENEKFLTISYPSSFESRSSQNLMDLKGMLCLPDTDHFRRSSVLDLWILKDKIICNWVKEYSINLVNFGWMRIFRVFRTWNEEILFIYSDRVVFYDLKRKSFRGGPGRIGFGITRGDSFYITGFEVYQKSLFSLGST